MDEPRYRLLSELSRVEDFLDDPVFTDVTHNGEVYTTYRIMRITHEITGHPDNWTHMANVSLEREIGLGVALLEIIDRAVERSRVRLSDTGS